ncbi:MAG: apolipoprotein N-acyltransferase [Actinobacteria bacterium]|nr:apolipoprotein N-acyltransferase [Actinomycetota bacterium]
MVTSLAFPPADVGALAFVSLIPLVVIYLRANFNAVAIACAAFGLGFFLPLLSWIHLFGAGAYFGLVGVEVAVFTSVMSILWLVTKKLGPAPKAFGFALALVISEYARGHLPVLGFTWGDIAYSQHDSYRLLRSASIGGPWAVSLLVVGVDATIGLITVAILSRGRIGSAKVITALALVALLIFGPWVIPVSTPGGNEAKIAVIQGNAPQDTLDPHYDDLMVAANHAATTMKVSSQNPSLVVWPESSFDQDPLIEPRFQQVLQDSIQAMRVPFLVGALLDQSVGQVPRFANSSVFFRSDGSVADIYVKQHLVPFGEYVPARRFFEPLVKQLERVPYDFVKGPGPRSFSIGSGSFASVICFESTFPEIVRGMVASGARLLIVSTNNSSFARTSASRQHLAFSQVRAAENRMWVMQAALTGISAAIDPDGRVVKRTALFKQATVVQNIRFATSVTPYARLGDWVPVAAIAAMLAMMFAGRKSDPPFPVDEPEPWQKKPQPDSLIVIPTFNEASNITSVLERLFAAAPDVDVLIVDDGSPDNTAGVARAWAGSNEHVFLLERPSKQGLGRAYLAGFRWGLGRGYEKFVEMDADLSHDPADVPRLLAQADVTDLVIGSRYVDGGAVVGWSRFRHGLSRSGNVYARILLGFAIRDATSGFRCFRRKVLEDVGLGLVHSNGYAFQIDMAYRAHRAGFSIGELPITFRERESGLSKMSKAIVAEAVTAVALWAIKHRLLRRP